MEKSSKDIRLSELKDLISQLNMTIKIMNIISFRNCCLTNSKEGETKVLKGRKNRVKYGTCYALMDLCDKWVNVQPGAEYGTVDSEKMNCINILSHLGCYQGGMIFPLDTGQGELEKEIESKSVSKEDIISGNRYLSEEEMKINARYIYSFFSEAGSAAFGLSQWNSSSDYFKWADENGLDANDIDVQLI